MEATQRSGERPMVKHLLPALALAMFLAPCQAVQSQLATQVEELAVGWRIVKRCGSWQAQGRDGHYRIVVGDVYDGAGSELYVQWVTQATQEQSAVVVKTVSIAELNDDHNQYDVESVDCLGRGRSTWVRVRATQEHDEGRRWRDITIRLRDGGGYSLDQVVRRSGR